MQTLALRGSVKLVFPPAIAIPHPPPQVSVRLLSINSAINRGIRRSQKVSSRPEYSGVSSKRLPGDSYGRERDGSKKATGSGGAGDFTHTKDFGMKSRRAETQADFERNGSPRPPTRSSERLTSSHRDKTSERYSAASRTHSSETLIKGPSNARTDSISVTGKRQTRWTLHDIKIEAGARRTSEHMSRGLRSVREPDERRHVARKDGDYLPYSSSKQKRGSSMIKESDEDYSKPWRERRPSISRESDKNYQGSNEWPERRAPRILDTNDDLSKPWRPTSRTRDTDDDRVKPWQKRRTSQTRVIEDNRNRSWPERRSARAREVDDEDSESWPESRTARARDDNEDAPKSAQERRSSFPPRDADDYRSKGSLKEERPLNPSRDPISIPYTTSASEFLYGTSSIIAAMQARRRQFYKLYIHAGANREVLDRDFSIRRLAKSLSIPIIDLRDTDGLRFLDKVSNSRPHNGYVLEASPIPKMPITALPRYALEEDGFRVPAGPQSREESEINGTSTLVPFALEQNPYPLILLLDGIQDPGNLGAIIRTAYYLGASAVAYVPRTTSSLTPTAVKASAGAAEVLPLFSVTTRTSDFILESRRAGWKVYAAVAPDSGDEHTPKPRGKLGKGKQPTLGLSALPPLLQRSPCVLILGGEGFGIQPKAVENADGKIVIRGAKRVQPDGLDSLNVSVAAGLLCSAFLRPGESNIGRITRGTVAHGEEEEEAAEGAVEAEVEQGGTSDSKKEGREGSEVDWSRLF